MLPIAGIAIPLHARARGSVITSMAELAANTGWLWDAGKMAEAVRTREDMLPTALEDGVALLHPGDPFGRHPGTALCSFWANSREFLLAVCAEN